MLEQRRQLLGLLIGQKEGVVNDLLVASLLPRPCVGVASENAGVALDLNEEKPLGAKNEQVDLVEAAVVRNEFKVRPRSVWIIGWKAGSDKIECFLLPRICRGSNDLPVCILRRASAHFR